ncbi:MAG: ABC transporter permease [Chitinophagales bacterium]|nr:ABC transporter permease [Chitinophagales bacterium]
MKTVIEAGQSKWKVNLREIFYYRDLLWMLAYRDFKIRYAQTVLGIVWAVIQPVFTLLIFIFVFNKAAKIDSGSIPYPVFAMTGMWAWSYLSYVITQAGQSIINAQQLVTKIYFPRLLIPFSKCLAGLIDFSITFVILLILLISYHVVPPLQIIALPFIIFILILLSLSAGIWLSALTIRFRDFQYIIPFLVQIGLYITPIAYPTSLIPSEYKWIVYLNPMAVLVDAFRWSLLNIPLPEKQYLLYSLSITVLLFVSSIFYFRKTESRIADII